MVVASSSKKIIALFDVDGTLTVPRNEITERLIELQKADRATTDFLQELRKFVKVGIVGGSDLVKICEQLGPSTVQDYDYVFAENGLVAHKEGKVVAVASLKTYLGEAKLKELINFTLHYVADLDIPVKRGTFIEFRNGMINISPIGRNCSQEERDEFEAYDKEACVRQSMVKVLRERFKDFGLTYSIGGQISFDVFPNGWDKTYCLQFLDAEFDDIHFFGDKTFVGGNDFEIFDSPRTIGHSVNSPMDTIQQCRQLFIKPVAGAS